MSVPTTPRNPKKSVRIKGLSVDHESPQSYGARNDGYRDFFNIRAHARRRSYYNFIVIIVIAAVVAVHTSYTCSRTSRHCRRRFSIFLLNRKITSNRLASRRRDPDRRVADVRGPPPPHTPVKVPPFVFISTRVYSFDPLLFLTRARRFRFVTSARTRVAFYNDDDAL